MDEAHRRLLDLLAGWSDWVDEDGNMPEAEAIAGLYQEAIAGLYQEAGAITDASNLQVVDFIRMKVIPFILTGKRQ